MKLYGVPPSPFVRKVVVVLEEKNIPYEYVSFTPFPKRPELTRMNPKEQIPILEHDGHFICDSSVICAYLDKVHPDKTMIPVEPTEFARVLFLEEYADTKLIDAISPIFRQRYLNPILFDEECDETVVQAAITEKLPPVFSYLEGLLTPKNTLPGPFGLADAALGSMLQCLSMANESIDDSRWPKLGKYLGDLLARPSFQKALSPEN